MYVPARKPFRLLMTAFEPFAGRARNASAEALYGLQARVPMLPDIALFSRLLPVESGIASVQAIAAVKATYPDMIICLGEATREGLCLETTGYNERQFRIPDNAGQMITESTIIDGAPSFYTTTLPLKPILAAIQHHNIPIRLSDDPGRFLCNEVFYSMLHHLAGCAPPLPAGFIHVPLLPEYDQGLSGTLPTSAVVSALEVIIAAITREL